MWPWAEGAPQNLGFPFYISATTEGSDIKMAGRWALPRPITKSHPAKVGVVSGHGLGELPKILGFSCNISATAESSDFNFGTQLWFAKAHHKITLRENVG